MAKRLVLGALLGAVGCVTYQTTVREFDSVAGHDREAVAEPASLTYRDEAERYPWLVRQLEWMGGGTLVGDLLAFEREQWRVENPAEFARERLVEMVDLAGHNLVRLSEVCWRLLMVIDRDGTSLNRALAVEQLADLVEAARSSRVRCSEPGFILDRDADAVFRRRAESLVGTLDAAWPKGGNERPGGEIRDEYATALRDLSRLDAGTLGHERSRLRAMQEAFETESDPALRDAAAGYLMDSLRSAANRGLATALTDPDPHVRETAVRRLWRLGGAEMLPWMLWLLEKRNRSVLPESEQSQAEADPDASVRRRLVLLSWAADLATAKVSHEGGPSPLEFLVDTALADDERSLRLAASEALAFLLRRPVDQDGTWIAAWWQAFVTEGRGKG